jgi:hypothetical protein
LTAESRSCPECQASLPLKTRNCPACNTLINPNAPEDPIKKAQEDAQFKTILMWGIGGMLLFFSFGFFLPAMLAEPGFIWVSAILFFAGATLLAWGYLIKVRLKGDIKRLVEETHVRCKYCNSINDKESHKCAFCGAPF